MSPRNSICIRFASIDYDKKFFNSFGVSTATPKDAKCRMFSSPFSLFSEFLAKILGDSGKKSV